MAYLWSLLMVLWLAALLVAVWWYWPIFAALALTAEFVAAFFYLLLGSLAWLVAFNLGRQRYWPR